MTDFIIVGRGLSANVLMHQFRRHGLTFKTIGLTTLSSSSLVAAGIWNPVVFKRMTSSWMAAELVPFLKEFYSYTEQQTGKRFVKERQIIKPFTEEHEKLLWTKKANTELSEFIDPEIYANGHEKFPGFNISNGYGLVKQSGNLDVTAFIEHTSSFFNDQITNEIFDYDLLQISDDCVQYKDLRAKNIIFCEGYLLKNNPWFNWVKLNPAKGEVLTIKAADLEIGNYIFNRNGFMMGNGGNEYKVGATYSWDQLNDSPTAEGEMELKQKLKAMTAGSYTITDHKAGVRPSSVDRRPVVGRHPKYSNLYIFNGLGAKGVMLAPFYSGNFVLFYLKKEALLNEVNVERFFPDYGRQKK